MSEENLEKVVEKIKNVYSNKKIISNEPGEYNTHNEFYIYNDYKEKEIPNTSILYNPQTERMIIKTTSNGELEEILLIQLNEIGISGKIKIETEPSYWNMLSEPIIENEPPKKEPWIYDVLNKMKTILRK